jgi:hypothetical protein
MRARFKRQEGVDVGLKAPGIITFMMSVILVVIVLVSKYAGAEIPVLKDHADLTLLGAYAILMMGCLMRGL